MRRNFFIVLGTLSFMLQAQVKDPVKWTFSTWPVSPGVTDLVFTASIEKNWHLYGLNIPENGPVPTSFRFNKSEGVVFPVGIRSKNKPEVKYDENFMMQVPLYSNTAVFIQRVNHGKSPATISGTIEYMSCDNMQCLPPREVEFSFNLPGHTAEQVAEDTVVKVVASKSGSSDILTTGSNVAGLSDQETTPGHGLLLFFMMSVLGGLLGLLTPCVFPMIPMTVSFFIRQTGSRRSSVMNALFYGFSIVVIYVLIGLLVGLTSAGANLGNQLNSHWLPNSLFFLLFISFALSFLGMFEIVLPGSMANATDRRVEKGGLVGVFFMALTFVIVSFSCTGPIVGAILVEAASGVLMKPVMGMLGFSLGMAVPFTLLALFPSVITKLPRSGGWMNNIKVFLAFIMMALSLKFLANIDQSYHLGFLSRMTYLVLWVSIFFMLFLYLLGIYRFSHDEPVSILTPGRMISALLVLAFTLYLATGLLGAPLSSLNTLLPPENPRQRIYQTEQPAKTTSLCGTPLYSDILHLPYGLEGYFDLDEGLACAKEKNKPVLIVFKGHACSNCKQMEARVWSSPEVQELMRRYIIIALYVDDRTLLPESKWITSKIDGKVKNTMGKKWADYQISAYSINTQPYHVITDSQGRTLIRPAGAMLKTDEFISFLKAGLNAFENLR